jgi:hypothetical protein
LGARIEVSEIAIKGNKQNTPARKVEIIFIFLFLTLMDFD